MNMKHLYTELDALSQSGSVTDNSITDDSVIEIYFDNTDVYLKTISQSGHVVSFTVDGNVEGTNVCVVVNNLTNFVPYDDTSINNRMDSIESDIDTITTELETIGTEIETLDSKVNNLSASNINYDEHSTLYSAMGDIDDLQTTSKNLVGAINEVKESGGGSSQKIYDGTPHIIGTWYGKTLYEISIVGTFSSSASEKILYSFNEDVDIVDISGTITTSDTAYPLSWYYNASNSSDIRVKNKRNLSVYTSTVSWFNQKVNVILKYTNAN